MDVFEHIGSFAQDITVISGGLERAGRAFIEPVSLKEPEREAEPTAAGLSDRRKYFFIAPEGAVGAGADEIVWNGGRYEVLRCERVGWHFEGVMSPKEGFGDA